MNATRKPRLKLVKSAGREVFEVEWGWKAAAGLGLGAVWTLFFMGLAHPFVQKGIGLDGILKAKLENPWWLMTEGLAVFGFLSFTLYKTLAAVSTRVALTDEAFALEQWPRASIVIPWETIRFVAPLQFSGGGILNGFTVVGQDGRDARVFSGYFENRRMTDAIRKRMGEGRTPRRFYDNRHSFF